MLIQILLPVYLLTNVSASKVQVFLMKFISKQNPKFDIITTILLSCQAAFSRHHFRPEVSSFPWVIRDLKHRQRNTQRQRSQPKEEWVEGFVFVGKN